MDQNTKNRLVGIAVVSALAVIFLPMVLDGSGVQKKALEVVIPAQPEVESNSEFVFKQIELQDKVEEMPDLEPRLVDDNSGDNPAPSESLAASKSEEVEVAKAESPVKSETGAIQKTESTKTGGDSWVLQVGSFQDRQKALVQRDKLRQSNIAAVFIEQFNVNNKVSYRVRLGPFTTRDLTRVAQNKIKAKHDIDGIIMKYER